MANGSAESQSFFIESPRDARITSDNHGAVISIIAWYCSVVMVLAVSTRMAIKAFRAMGRDDPPIVVALVMAPLSSYY